MATEVDNKYKRMNSDETTLTIKFLKPTIKHSNTSILSVKEITESPIDYDRKSSLQLKVRSNSISSVKVLTFEGDKSPTRLPDSLKDKLRKSDTFE